MTSSGKHWDTVTEPMLVIEDDVAILQNNAHMPQNDAAFCTWILHQLYDTERDHMVEPFYHLGDRLLDMGTLYQRLHHGGLADAAQFEEQLVSIPTKFSKKYPILTHQHEKANALLLDLPGLFKQRNRWENQRRRNQQRQQRQQQQQQVPAVPSTSAPSSVASTAAAPVTVAASALDHDAATDAALDTCSQPRFRTPLTIRTSATPGPSGRPTINTSRQVSQSSDHDSALRQARVGKKRAASDEDIGTGSKRARPEVDKYKYRDLRVEIAGVIDREMSLVHQQRASMELEEGAHRYVNQLSQMDVQAMQKAKKVDLNEFEEDHVAQIEQMLVKYVRDEINRFLATKGRSIQPRVSLSIEGEHEHDDDDEIGGSETYSESRVDEESSSKIKVKKEQH